MKDETRSYIFSHRHLPIYFTIIAKNLKEAKELLKVFAIKMSEVNLIEKVQKCGSRK